MSWTEGHPEREVENLLAGTASDGERNRAVLHLLAGCPSCARRMRQGMRLQVDSQAAESELTAALDRMLEQAAGTVDRVESEEAIAQHLLAGLASHPHGRVMTVLASSRRHQRRAVCERLIAASIRSRRHDPTAARAWAERAVTVAERLDGEGADELRARAWMHLANARRIGGDLATAEDGFAEAGRWLDRDGGADPLVRAELFSLLASLRDYQRRLDEALQLARRARRLYQRVGDRTAVARTWIQMATFYGKVGRTGEGLGAVWKGLQILGAGEDLHTLFVGIHNLIQLLVDQGSNRLARQLLSVARPLYRSCGGAIDLLRHDWLVARLEIEEGALEAAAAGLETVRRRFAERELTFEVAVASLDLARVHAQRGETAALHRTAAEMLPVFRRLGVARDALATVVLLQQAEARDAQTLVLIRGLAAAVTESGAGARRPAAG